jgi:hypothetical protein
MMRDDEKVKEATGRLVTAVKALLDGGFRPDIVMTALVSTAVMAAHCAPNPDETRALIQRLIDGANEALDRATRH